MIELNEIIEAVTIRNKIILEPYSCKADKRGQGVCQISDTEFPDFSLTLSSFPWLSFNIL